MPTKDITALPDGTAMAPAAPDAGQPTAQAFEEPAAGGNYVRCPDTGALSPNPAFASPSNASTPTPQE